MPENRGLIAEEFQTAENFARGYPIAYASHQPKYAALAIASWRHLRAPSVTLPDIL
jgi:hypothetical protein